MRTITDYLYPVVMGLIWAFNSFYSKVLRVIGKQVRGITRAGFKSGGIMINPNKENKKPGDIELHNEEFYHRLALEQTLGLGDMYVEGWWDCENLDVFFTKVFKSGLYKQMAYPWHHLFNYLQFQVFNLQTAARSWEVAEKHYDLGNDLYTAFLDSSMTYTCGYWKNAKDLEEAQQHKLDLIARKLKLQPGMKVLDVGCGWGGLSKYLAEKYQVSVVGVTISIEGARLAQQRCKGLPVEIRCQDYREVNEKFDRIAAIGILEHVGRKNYREFFELAHRCLPEQGLMLVHTIGLDNDCLPPIEPWMNKYIFPNGILPDHKDIPKAVDRLFCIEDWHNFGQDYDKTLMAWHRNFVRNWPTISHLFEEPKKFFRMWTYYLMLSAGAFRARRTQLWQVVLSKDGIPGGYLSER